MADIRQNPGTLDDFNRADEDPLSGGGNWARPDLSTNPMVLFENAAARKGAATNCYSTWQPGDVMDGDAAESWGVMIGNETSGARWGVTIFRDLGGTSTADGYMFAVETSNTNDVYRIYRATNFSFTSIAITGDVAPEGGPVILLIRRNGDYVEGWSDETGVGDSFSLRLQVTDTTHTTGFRPGLHGYRQIGSDPGFVSFDYFGAGPAVEFIPQFLRRPND